MKQNDGLAGPLVHIVDDDCAICDALKVALATWGIRAVTYSSPLTFLGTYNKTVTGLLIVDYRMPEMNGLELISALKKMGSSLLVILMTGEANAFLREESKRLGALELIEKPVSIGRLVGLVYRHPMSGAFGLEQATSHLG